MNFLMYPAYMNWKHKIPLSIRMKISHFRQIRSPFDLLGRYSVGALQSYVASSVQSNAWRMVRIDRAVQVHRGTLLHINDLAGNKKIIIGERVFVGQNCYFSAGDLIELGRDSLIGASCKFLGAGHTYTDPTIPFARANVVSYGKIILEPNSWIGTNSTLLGNIQIGFGTVIAASTILRNSVPPLCLVAGNPARVIKFFNWHKSVWEPAPAQDPEYSVMLQQHLERLPTVAEFTSRLDLHL